MRGKTRNLFPGGNTPQGFYSYYEYILGQKEAEAIVCLKGGPGVGKSSFMKGIAEYFVEKGEDVDYFWCSSDPGSLDGILLKKRKIAMVDGTSPHIIDPQNPGAVDTILHLGEYWDGEVLKKCKSYIMQSNQKIKGWFGYAYNNLHAAAALQSSIRDTYRRAMLPGELYKAAAGIVNREFSRYEILLAEGSRKKYFAAAITPEGLINHMPGLVKDYKKLYFLTAPVGFETENVLNIISENAVHRGFSVEEYYCPMMPETKMEHLLIPDLEMGFVTLNSYHDLELWENDAEIQSLEMRDFIDWNRLEETMETIEFCEAESDQLIHQAIRNLKKAKQEHDRLEAYYIPNMNFEKIEELKAEMIGKIERNVL